MACAKWAIWRISECYTSGIYGYHWTLKHRITPCLAHRNLWNVFSAVRICSLLSIEEEEQNKWTLHGAPVARGASVGGPELIHLAAGPAPNTPTHWGSEPLTCVHASRVQSQDSYRLPECSPTVLELRSPGDSPASSAVSLSSLWISTDKFQTHVRISTTGEGKRCSVHDIRRMGGLDFWLHWFLTSQLFGDAFVVSSVYQSLYPFGKVSRFP
jgi:hypothetical protein